MDFIQSLFENPNVMVKGTHENHSFVQMILPKF